MKLAMLFFVVFSCVYLSAATLLNENFTSTPPVVPAGWTFTGPQPTAWSVMASTNAGGTANEVRLNYSPSGYGTYRLISPPIDTHKVHDMTLSFRHYFDHYDPQEFVSLAVELGHDTESFDWELWYAAPTEDIGPTQVSVPVSFDLGMSETTYISFVFRGNNWNINAWYIDDILLTYNNTLGSGTWAAGTYYPVGDLIIPNGHTLTLQPGTILYFGSDKKVSVQGRILANGSAAQPIYFSTVLIRTEWSGIQFDNVNTANDSSLIAHAVIEYSNYSGIYIYNTSKVRVTNSQIRFNTATNGGGVYLQQSNAVIENCNIYDNVSTLSSGGGIAAFYGTPVLRYNRIFNNSATGSYGATLYLSNCNVSGIYGNQISGNFMNADGYGVRIYQSSGTFSRNLISNNAATGLYIYSGNVTVLNCDIVNNGGNGFYNYANTAVLKNTILWNNAGYAIRNYQSWDHINISYCCFNSGSTYQVITTDITDCLSSDPLFVNPATGTGTGGWNISHDWRLQYNSPCIDAGHPSSPYNPDGSREDIGMYYRQLRPILTKAADVPDDQGHKLDLVWKSSDIDVTFYANAFYSVWRDGTGLRSENLVFVSDPSYLQFGQDVSNVTLAWRDGDRTWYYLEQVHAVMDADYGLFVDTPYDSSSTGTHDSNYLVRYHNSNGIWASAPLSGYSVDNIPPLAPSRLDISRLASGTYNLSWEEVTGGYLDGNFEEEINLITYKVYAGDTCDFIPSPDTYLTSTTDPAAVLTGQTADHKFYKVVASDSE
jgi:hypothetical protein